MTLVFVVQDRTSVFEDEILPGYTDRNNDCVEFVAYCHVGIGEGLLSLRHILAGPREIQSCLRP